MNPHKNTKFKANNIGCSNRSLLECSSVMQAARVRFPAETCWSWGAFGEMTLAKALQSI
jgi:hypothetical protein